MLFSRAQVAQAVIYWGEAGDGGGEIAITRQASRLVDVLAAMDFHREDEVLVGLHTERGRLLAQALGLPEPAAPGQLGDRSHQEGVEGGSTHEQEGGRAGE